MISTLTLRDSTGRIKTFSKNQDFSAYEKHNWKLGKGLNGEMVTYLEVPTNSHITLGFGDDPSSFMIIHVFAGDFFTLEDEYAPAVNPLTPLGT
jgi:hypothetical protein